MPRLLLLLFLCFGVRASFGQERVTAANTRVLTGVVNDASNGTALPYVTVSLLEAENKHQVKHALTQDNGSFQLTGIPVGKTYQLVLAYVGYQTRTIDVAAASSNLNLGTIPLRQAVVELQEVEVQAERQIVEHDLDKLTYHVEADPEQHILTALEMMRKVPFLALDGDNRLTMNGSDSYLVHINGKPSALFSQDPSEVLQSLPANSIKRVEVITNPPSRYDAEGVGGIINIVTHRKTISGYNGSVNLGATHPQGGTAGGYLTAKAGKLSFSGNANNSTAINPTSFSSFRRKDLLRNTLLQQNGEGTNRYTNHFASVELNYELTTHDLLTASYRINGGEGQSRYQQEVELLDVVGSLAQHYRNLNDSRNQRMSQDAGIDYQRSFANNTERLLTLSYRYGNNSTDNVSDFSVEPLLNYNGRVSQTGNENMVREHTWQADYVQPLGKQTLELGLKHHSRYTGSVYDYRNQSQETGRYEEDPLLSNHFDYRQDIGAAYASLNLQAKGWGMRAGTRLEETRVIANFRDSEHPARQHYFSLVPSLNLSRKLQKNGSIRLSYAQRLERPTQFHINPYVNLIDPRNISYGNPALKPSVNHVLNLGYSTYHQGTSLSVGALHQFTNNAIQYLTTLGEDTIARSTFENVGRRQSHGLSLNGSTMLFKKLHLGLNGNANYIYLTGSGQRQNQGITWNATGNASLRVRKTWRLNANVGYTAPQILLQGKSASFVSNSFTLNKELLKQNKASLSLAVRNPFQQYRRFLSEVQDPAFWQWQESYSVIRQYSATFQYRFGKVHAGAPRKRMNRSTAE
jgi:outer membrane cobalamin receptor